MVVKFMHLCYLFALYDQPAQRQQMETSLWPQYLRGIVQRCPYSNK